MTASFLWGVGIIVLVLAFELGRRVEQVRWEKLFVAMNSQVERNASEKAEKYHRKVMRSQGGHIPRKPNNE